MRISFVTKEYERGIARGIDNGRIIRLGLIEDGLKIFGS